ncbi:MAG: membrane integrity-associated transporter subunit PqiC [Nitrospirae bacterium]|nr:membrane integrity-associated transporter subunit PqiC [Candidatus Manganitrophaceae bacterium]
MGRRVFLSLFLTVVAACSFPGPVKEKVVHTYLLNPDWTATAPPETIGRGAQGRGAMAVLLVALPQAQSGFDTERIAYLRRPNEVGYYAASEWADTPARMLAPLLVQALERTDTWQAVVPTPTAVRGDYRVDSDDLALSQEFFEAPSRVRLTLRAQLVDLQQLRPVGTKVFEVFEPAPSEDAYGGVLAANRAVARLLGELSDWIARCKEARPSDPC